MGNTPIILGPEGCDLLNRVAPIADQEDLALSIISDFYATTECTAIAPDSAQIDYYINALTELRNILSGKPEFDPARVGQILSPVIDLFKSAKSEHREMILNCYPEPCRYFRRAIGGRFEKESPEKVDEILMQAGLSNVQALKELKNHLLMSKFSPNSNVTVIYLSDSHDSIKVQAEYLDLIDGLFTQRDKKVLFFHAVENSSDIPKAVDVEGVKNSDLDEADAIIKELLEENKREGGNLLSAYAKALSNEKLPAVLNKIIKAVLPKTLNDVGISLVNMASQIAGLVLSRFYPELESVTWPIEDTKLYGEHIKELTTGEGHNTVDLAEKRSRASAAILMKKIEEERKKSDAKIVVFARLGGFHAFSFLEALKKENINILAFNPKSIWEW